MKALQLSRFACPFCKGELQQQGPAMLMCRNCLEQFPVMGRIPVFHSPEKLASILRPGKITSDHGGGTHARFEEEWQHESHYRQVRDPWGYRSRAAEMLKYGTLVRLCWMLTEGTSRRILDLGCGLGLLATELAGRGATVTAIDLSPAAVDRAERSRRPGLDEPVFAAGSAAAMPIADGSIDLMVMADGLFSWGFDEDKSGAVLRQAAAALDEGGKILLMDYLRPGEQAAFLGLAPRAQLRVTAIVPLHDRPWYGVEFLLRPFRNRRWCRSILKNLWLARMLALLGRALGRHGSAHIAVVAEKGRVSSP